MSSHAQEVVAAAAHKVTVAGSATSVVGWAVHNDFGMWAGIVIGLAGLLTNWYYKAKNDRRAAEAHRVYMARQEEKERERTTLLDSLPPIHGLEDVKDPAKGQS